MTRAALSWSVSDLALAADVAPNMVTNLELGRSVRASTIEKIMETFERCGIVFITTPQRVGVCKEAV